MRLPRPCSVVLYTVTLTTLYQDFLRSTETTWGSLNFCSRSVPRQKHQASVSSPTACVASNPTSPAAHIHDTSGILTQTLLLVRETRYVKDKNWRQGKCSEVIQNFIPRHIRHSTHKSSFRSWELNQNSMPWCVKFKSVCFSELARNSIMVQKQYGNGYSTPSSRTRRLTSTMARRCPANELGYWCLRNDSPTTDSLWCHPSFPFVIGCIQSPFYILRTLPRHSLPKLPREPADVPCRPARPR